METFLLEAWALITAPLSSRWEPCTLWEHWGPHHIWELGSGTALSTSHPLITGRFRKHFSWKYMCTGGFFLIDLVWTGLLVLWVALCSHTSWVGGLSGQNTQAFLQVLQFPSEVQRQVDRWIDVYKFLIACVSPAGCSPAWDKWL